MFVIYYQTNCPLRSGIFNLTFKLETTFIKYKKITNWWNPNIGPNWHVASKLIAAVNFIILVVLEFNPKPRSTSLRLYFPKPSTWHQNWSFSWPGSPAVRCFFLIEITTRHPTAGLLRHDGMFYIGHNAINYFFDGSLFVMLINAGVPPPSLLHADENAFYNHRTLNRGSS